MVTGKGPTDIVSVDATVLSFLDSLDVEYAGQFLVYIASIQYKGANPQQAKDWVIKNINNSSETNIGGVNFRLIANSDKNRILKMYMSE